MSLAGFRSFKLQISVEEDRLLGVMLKEKVKRERERERERERKKEKLKRKRNTNNKILNKRQYKWPSCNNFTSNLSV